MSEKRSIDWQAIRVEYEDTTRPVIGIARDHGISHTAINKRARLECWKNPRKAVSGGSPGVVSEPVAEGPETDIETADETHHDLTPRQRMFVREYLIDLNGAQATIRAGYSTSDAYSRASRLLDRPAVAAAVKRAMNARAERLDVTADRVLQELAKIGFANMLDYVQIGADGDPFVSLAKLTRGQAAAIGEITVEDFKDGRGEFARDVRKVKFKLLDKRSALVDIAKHLGMFIERHELTGKEGAALDFGGMSEAELDAFILARNQDTAGGGSGGEGEA